jgi:hypothetical protein
MDDFARFLANYSLDVQAITQELRTLVKNAMSQGQEVLYADRDHIGYSFTGRYSDRVIYICPMKDYVRLGFMWGGPLPDPGRLLVGEGKRLRHIKVRSASELKNAALKQLIDAAWDDGMRHAKQTS